MTTDTLNRVRAEKHAFFKTSRHSPLTPQQRETFDGLTYYPHNPALDLTLTIEPFATPEPVEIQTTTGDTREYLRYGRVHFDVDGQTVSLTLYETPHGFFLPFVDAGAGVETYPAGRYLDVQPEVDGHTVQVDFNQAYNPYCAYNELYSCPITPAENRVKVAVRAGEMLPQGAWLGK